MAKGYLSDTEKYEVRDMGAEAVAMHSSEELAALISKTMQLDVSRYTVKEIVKSLKFKSKRMVALSEQSKKREQADQGDADRRLAAIEAKIDKIGASLESIPEELTKPPRTAHEGNGQGRNHLLV